MSKKMYQPLYWGDYLRDTAQLSVLEHGVYLLLIGQYWSTGKPIPNDAVRMRTALRLHSESDAAALQYVLETYFTLDGKVWRHSRIDSDLKLHAAHAERASNAARAGANARWEKEKKRDKNTDANRMRSASGSDANHPNPKGVKKTPLPPGPVDKSDRKGVGVDKSFGGGSFDISHHLSDSDLEEAKRIADGWDIYRLFEIYNLSVKERMGIPRYPAKAFKAWLAIYTKGKKPG